MTNKEAVNWIINLTADIGKMEHQSLWHYEQALDEIRELLEIEPECKTGHWILSDSVNERYEDIECSVCGKIFTVDAKRYCDIGFIVGDLKYCPHCGCKMEVEHE